MKPTDTDKPTMRRTSDLVRASRAGDQFHYRWATRRCLVLLNPSSELIYITIEGVSPSEPGFSENTPGKEVIDLAEYFGDTSTGLISKISYFQLKHSYQDRHWTLSGLKKTLKGFFDYYRERMQNSANWGQLSIEFIFMTNRPVAEDICQLIERIKSRSLKDEDTDNWSKIKEWLEITDDELAYEFFATFSIDDSENIHWEQRNILIQELRGHMPGPDNNVAEQLWHLVCKKAMPEYANNPEIRKEDVLRCLNTDVSALFPAPSSIEDDDNHFVREQEKEFLQKIIGNDSNPIIIHAEGGVGKTALANRLKQQLPNHSVAVLYDCFGNGEYRNPIHLRHLHSKGLVQMANEFSALELCYPLIPNVHLQPSDYIKAFLNRLEQAIEILKADNTGAKLVIFIDAADNAEMVAEEHGEIAGFAKDLIRQKLPDGVVAVFLCRSHRIQKLNPPLNCVELQLKAFSENETRQHLTLYFPEATQNDVLEFHRLTSQNPRLQATALEQDLSLSDMLSAFGPNPLSVEDSIKMIFERSLQKLMDNLSEAESDQIRTLCEALAILKPYIPIDVLASVSGVEESAIRSFLSDLGRPVCYVGNAVQFFDEPSETWFRETYKPNRSRLRAFIRSLISLADSDSYIASALPQLMLEAGLYKKLLKCVFEDKDLPQNSIDRRDILLQRLQFSIKAALRIERYDDAAKLALKAGGEMAGNERQQKLLQENTDLVSQFMSGHRIRETVTQGTFSTSWHGGHNAYSACLLSGCPETLPESRSYLRLAWQWLENWSQLSKEEKMQSKIADKDIVAIALCRLRLDGPTAFVQELNNWEPKAIAYQIGSIVFRQLIDLGKINLVDEIVQQSANNVYIQLAAIDAESDDFKCPPKEVTRVVIDYFKKFPQEAKEICGEDTYKKGVLSTVNSAVQASISCNIHSFDELAEILDMYIPTLKTYHIDRFTDEPRSSILRAITLRAMLKNAEINLGDLVKPNAQKGGDEDHQQGSEKQRFLKIIGIILPWHKLWVGALLKQFPSDLLEEKIDECLAEINQQDYFYYYHESDRWIVEEICRLWTETIILADSSGSGIERLIEWMNSLENGPSTSTLNKLVRLCSHTDNLKQYGFSLAQKVFDIIDESRMDAEEKMDAYLNISRSIFLIDKEEAKYYFEKTVDIASSIGSENIDRWSALCNLAIAASEYNQPNSELSYRFSCAAEYAYEYFYRDKHFDWGATIEAITKVCPAAIMPTISRWKDRKFCDINRCFPTAIDELMELEHIRPETMLALVGYQYNWPYIHIVKSAFSAINDDKRAKDFCNSTLRHIDIRGGIDVKDYEKIVGILIENSWEASYWEDKLSYLKELERMENSSAINELENHERQTHPSIDWEDIFLNLDARSLDSVQNCYRKYRNTAPPYSSGEFVANLFLKVPFNHEESALKNIFSVTSYSLHYLIDILLSIPKQWLSRNHIKNTLSALIKETCRRNFDKVEKFQYYDRRPFDFIYQNTDISKSQIYQWAIDAYSESPSVFDSGSLFSLIDLIAPALNSEQALDVLDYGLKMLEKDMNEDDGDGGWKPSLEPPPSAVASLAGYIWASLASPRTSERWEAAHVVCLLCLYEEKDILKVLLDFAEGRMEASAFHDSRLPFYALSARLWLLIALRRSVGLGYSDSVLLFEQFIRQACNPSESHIICREVAANILLVLHSREKLILSTDKIKSLREINKPKKEVIYVDYHNEQHMESFSGLVSDCNGYNFGIDIPKYWFQSLGRIFDLSEKEIGNRASKIIREEFDCTGDGGWKADPRNELGIYRDGETRHSHGSYPRTEDLSFYHSYHSMMMVTGELLDTAQVYQQEGYGNELKSWVDRHLTTRTDGLWLADRRDPMPLRLSAWKYTKEDENWPFSVSKEDLMDIIHHDNQFIYVWGDWKEVMKDREEDVEISSALVNKDVSASLLCALQTVLCPYNYSIPFSGKDSEVDMDSYRLKGWVSPGSREHGIDARDPWSGEMIYPPIRPAKWFVEEMNLISDSEQRSWSSGALPEKTVFCSRMWSNKPGYTNYYSSEAGYYLLADIESVKTWLKEKRMDLLIEVRIDRSFKRDSYWHRQVIGSESIWPYTLLLLVDENGNIKTL